MKSFAIDGGTRGAALACAAALVASIALAPALCRAQSATIQMSADRTDVQVGQSFRLQVRLDVQNAEAPEPTMPDLAAFDIVSRQLSRPMQFRFGFGSQTQVVQSTAVYSFVLRARTPGRVELAPPRARIGNQEFVGNALTIIVGGSAPAAGNDPGGNQQAPVPSTQPPTGFDGMIYDDQAFVRTVVDQEDPYVGEQVTVTMYLYVRGPLRAAPVTTQEPTTDGFWTHDLLPPQRTLEATTQVFGSTPFRVYVLRRFAAFPLRAGDLTITAMTLQIPIGGVFDIFAGPQPDLERTGVPVTVHAREVPAAGRPPGEVHVGRLTLEASLDRTQVPTGDAVTLTLRATGSGHVQSVRVADPRAPGLRVLNPQAQDQVSSPGDLVGGVRTLEWLIVPEREGEIIIPAFRVPVFDPQTETYSVAESAPITLTAAGNPVAAPIDPEEDGSAPDLAGADGAFGPVRTESALSRDVDRVADRPWYPWAVAAFPAAWLGLVLAGALRRRSAARAGRDAPARASREAKKRLAAAETAANGGDARAFYAAISLSLKSVLEGRLGESVGSLTHPQLRKRLSERGMADELSRRIVEELEGLEFARFSAIGAARTEMDAALVRARELIGLLDRFVPAPTEDA